MKLTLGQIADWIHAEGDFDTSREAVGYSIDSRTIGAGELFFAVKGERVDGHDYVPAAITNGAVAAVVGQRWLAPAGFDATKLLRVPDDCDDCVLRAMQQLAHSVRRAWGRRVIGVTGSAGKTTTKECLAQVLSARFRVLKTEGNFNNHFGLPLTLLRLQPDDEVAVLEMGMNHAGEIRALAKIAEPDWGVVSNVGPVHLEFFPDGIDGIARAKYELIESLPPGGKAFLNGDDARVAAFARGMGSRAVLFGLGERCHIRAIGVTPEGLDGSRFTITDGDRAKRVHLHLPGSHNVLNALAAAAVGVASGQPLSECVGALEAMRPTAKRGDTVEFRGARLVNDCYNSNPKALDSMVQVLAEAAATRRIVVAGEMLELGPEGPAMHERSGEAMGKAGVDFVLGVRGLARHLVAGAERAGTKALFVDTPEQAGEWLKANLKAGDVVLLKASRGVKLERALDVLLADSDATHPAR